MSQMQYIFFDIDGTIVSEDGFLPESAVRAIRAARAKGNVTIINTGRTAMNVDDFIRDIGFDGCIYGCGTEMEYNGKSLFHETQSPQTTRDIVRLVRQTGTAVLYECPETIHYDSKARMLPGLRSLLEHYHGKGTAFYDVPPESKADWCMDKFVIWYDAESDLAAFQEGICGKFDYIDRGNGFAEMVPCGFSKATAMKQLMDLLGAKPEQVYAIGDSLNDRPMLELAGTGIAMGEGVMLHPYADYVTANLRDDGLEKALAHFGLI